MNSVFVSNSRPTQERRPISRSFDQTRAILGRRPWWPGGELDHPPLDKHGVGPEWAAEAAAAKAELQEKPTKTS